MNDDVRDALAVACRERGITSAAVFRERFGIAPAALTAPAAFDLVMTPAWVIETWIPNAGSTPVVWVPAAVRTYAAVFEIHQQEGESDHAFTLRLLESLMHVTAANGTRHEAFQHAIVRAADASAQEVGH